MEGLDDLVASARDAEAEFRSVFQQSCAFFAALGGEVVVDLPRRSDPSERAADGVPRCFREFFFCFGGLRAV